MLYILNVYPWVILYLECHNIISYLTFDSFNVMIVIFGNPYHGIIFSFLTSLESLQT